MPAKVADSYEHLGAYHGSVSIALLLVQLLLDPHAQLHTCFYIDSISM